MGLRVVVIGAGAFGGWTALELVRRGARVTLLDAWGPGHARSSSGGETRVIRAGYGTRAIYTAMAVRALERWRAHDARYGRQFFRRTGALWMFSGDDAFGRASIAALRDAGQPVEELALADAAHRYPHIRFDDVRSTFLEPEAGVLLARRACEHVVECLIAEGGEYRCAEVESPDLGATVARCRIRGDRDAIPADVFVFACGPWLPRLFGDLLGGLLQATRQEVHYFGTPAGDPRYSEDGMPVWLDMGAHLVYGIPGNAYRGFKIADDSPGPVFDPTDGDRAPDLRAVAGARAYLARRFPALADAPFIGAEVCQYESTPDAHFIVDRHPAAPNVWILGGGSGHGFKMGPVIGEIAAAAVLGTDAPDAAFAIRESRRP